MAAPMRKRRKYPSALGDVLPGALRFAGAARRARLWKILARWEDVVGTAVAQHARPSGWRGKTLVILVDHHAWMTELSFLKPRILEQLRASSPDVHLADLRFELGELPPLPERRRGNLPRPPPRPLSRDEQEFLDHILSPISDEGVRDAARRAIACGLARRNRSA